MANKLESGHKEHEIETAPEEQKTKCSHYWIIETAHGPTSKGVCKYCGEEKEFLNAWQDSLWEGDLSTLFGLPGLPDIGPERDEDS